MTHEKDRAAPAAHLFHLRQALLLKRGVPDGQHFIQQQHLLLNMGSDGKSQTQIHSSRVELHRHVQKWLDFGESYDLIELTFDFSAFHSQDRRVKVDVFASGQIRVKASTDFQKASYPTIDIYFAG